MSFLPLKNTDELFDFQILGNFNNWIFGITPAPSDNVLTIAFKIDSGGTITTFLAYKISIDNDTVTIVDTISLISSRTISAIVENNPGVSYKVTTSVAHYYEVGDVVTQSGFVAPDAAYNGAKTILSVPTATEYIVAGTYTNNVTGAVIKSLVSIDQTGEFYSIKADEGLASNLAGGLYYYFFSDGVIERKSDIFCIDENISDFSIYLIDEVGDFLADDVDDLLVTF